MFFGTNIEHAKALNRRGVFDAVRRQGHLTRAEVARATGLSQQSVSNIVGELERAGLVRADGRRFGGRGQPGIELSVNPSGGYSIGLHVGHRRLTAVLADLTGAVVAETRLGLPATPIPDAYAPILVAAVDGLLSTAQLTRDRIWGVGCVLPGLIEHGMFTLVSPTIQAEWRNFPLASWLQDLLKLPVIVENDATAAAIGEQLYGIGREVNDFFYIHFGLGLGGGMVLGGRSYRGAQGHAGRIGHMIARPGGRLCTCGNRGCLEQYVSLFAALEAIDDPGHSNEDTDRILECWRAGDPRLLAWIEQAAVYLRYAVHTVETLFDTSRVVVGGGDMPEPVLDALLERLLPLLPRLGGRDSADRAGPRVVKAATTSDMPALGATALPIARQIEPDLSLIWDGRPDGGAGLAGLFDRG